ncbi:hypothetical protein SAMN05421841_0041 [Chryseobacterium wanjuense]|uniref:Uncharacterized protein n=1 Tax=Chryseobacterium wanjuense TaxID=356305 RepID=A0A1I0MKL7_9FLAO|nr:hypothetical protein SAMN05421841_0041 [Chryseobacterium wanjuense]
MGYILSEVTQKVISRCAKSPGFEQQTKQKTASSKRFSFLNNYSKKKKYHVLVSKFQRRSDVADFQSVTFPYI